MTQGLTELKRSRSVEPERARRHFFRPRRHFSLLILLVVDSPALEKINLMLKEARLSFFFAVVCIF